MYNTMKTCILLFVAALATLTLAELKINDDFKEVSESCIKSSGVEEDLVARGRKNDFVEDAKLKNYYTCVLQKKGMQNADGTFETDAMIEKLPLNIDREVATSAIRKCIKVDAATPADAAYDVVKCFVNAISTKA